MDEKLNKKLAKMLEEQGKALESIEEMLPLLQQVEKNLRKVNEMSGATKRARDIRAEILLKGWDTISKIYTPENNTSDPAAVPLFEFYKYIYNDMKNKNEILEVTNAAQDTDVA